MPRTFKEKDIKNLLERQTQNRKPQDTSTPNTPLSIKGLAKPTAKHPAPLAKTLAQALQHGRRIREKKMNKTERAFSELLEKAKKSGEILKWHFEEITLKIAPNTRYTPDFVAVLPSGNWHVFEIKGHLEDDASVKFKSAAQRFPEISFQMLRRKKGAWETVFKLPASLTPTHFNPPLSCTLPPPNPKTPPNLTKGKPKKKKQG
jgi:hypothetical protein